MAISEVYNCDCLEYMKGLPNNFADLAICDPPYGIKIMKQWGAKKHGYKQYKVNEWDNNIPSPDYFNELLRVSKNQIIWGGNYFTENLPASQGWILWDKGQRDFSLADGELAWTSFNKAIRIFDYSRGKMQAESYGKFHPTQKPIKLYQWILNNYGGGVKSILDTHLGSGSSRIVAYDLGFDFYGTELDKDYYDAQEKRFAKHIAQQQLFMPVQELAKQITLL